MTCWTPLGRFVYCIVPSGAIAKVAFDVDASFDVDALQSGLPSRPHTAAPARSFQTAAVAAWPGAVVEPSPSASTSSLAQVSSVTDLRA
jgi:hypothetical protein